uniref:Uncharacterized protein n=1 Tax=Pristhesancus plagipennis TaxID=1955184 RepID=A0A2K8JMC2_PRIPG|nr:secreted hypothetical protein [Pristhesancus plagipennis]
MASCKSVVMLVVLFHFIFSLLHHQEEHLYISKCNYGSISSSRSYFQTTFQNNSNAQ